MKPRMVKVSAPGKVILSGEHAVVYSYPALVAAVNKRLSITRIGNKKEIDSDIPIGCGMGSSAAFAVASSALNIKLKGERWDLEKINQEAYKREKKQHGNPSGGDNTISTYGGFLWYRKEAESLKTFSQIHSKRKLSNLFAINTGRPNESTKEMVSYVAGLYRKRKSKIDSILKDIGEVTKAFLRYLLAEENLSLEALIKGNESLLENLGVVSKSTIQLIREIEKIGGAAKVSGAGGKKDKSGILLAYHQDPDRLVMLAKDMNLDIFPIRLGEGGVRVEK